MWTETSDAFQSEDSIFQILTAQCGAGLSFALLRQIYRESFTWPAEASFSAKNRPAITILTRNSECLCLSEDYRSSSIG